MRYYKTLKYLLFILCAGLFCSCSIKNNPPQPIAYYTLDYETTVFEAHPSIPVTLSIEKFRTVAPYNSNRIIYSNKKYSQSKYHYHQWMAPPAEMITRLMVRDFTTSKRFQAVTFSNDPMTSHLLRGTIDEIYEQDADDQWNAVLSVTIILINKHANNKSGQIIFQKNYRKVHPLNQKNPQCLSHALSMALSEISGMILSDVYNILNQDL